MSDPIRIIEKLSRAAAAIGAVGKDSRNAQHGFNFRGIDAVVNATSPAFIEEGIVCYPYTEQHSVETIEVGSNRTKMRLAVVLVRFTFTDGESSIMVTTPGEAFDSGDKATAKAMSVALRTALLQTLMLPTTEADPDASTYEVAPAPSAEQIDKWAEERRNELAKAVEDEDLQAVRKVWHAVNGADWISDNLRVALLDEVQQAGDGMVGK